VLEDEVACSLDIGDSVVLGDHTERLLSNESISILCKLFHLTRAPAKSESYRAAMDVAPASMVVSCSDYYQIARQWSWGIRSAVGGPPKVPQTRFGRDIEPMEGIQLLSISHPHAPYRVESSPQKAYVQWKGSPHHSTTCEDRRQGCCLA